MKILMVNYNDMSGGSAKSVYRLHRALIDAGVDSEILVSLKQRQDKRITGADTYPANVARRMRLAGDKLPLLIYPRRQPISFSTQWLPNRTPQQVHSLKPDLVNLHWIGHGMLTIEALSTLPQPMVWTLHDVWPFTGGCHVNLDCQRYQQSCGRCPQLGSKNEDDLSHKIWQRKKISWRNLKLTFVAPSRWMAAAAERSPLSANAKIEIIPHGVDTQIYLPQNKLQTRDELNLPRNKKLILFGSAGAGRHKGFALLQQAINLLVPAKKNSLELIIFGPNQATDLKGLGLAVHSFGQIQDEQKLAQLYAAADLTVIPSLQESFGLVAAESLACATPVVSFATTGLLDIVGHEKEGYLAQPFEAADLANGIIWLLEDETRLERLGQNGRTKVENEFDIKLQAERYQALYRSLLQ